MAGKLIIEARVNEYAARRDNPNVPWTPEEIARDAAACREAGAGIIHFHARNADGSPNHDSAEYAAAVGRVREVTDALVHPTLGANALDAPAERRIAHVMEMARDPRTRPDFAPMDMGSANLDLWDARNSRFRTTDTIYKNSTGTLQHFAERIRAAGLKPVLVSWSIPFTRNALAFLEAGLVDEPLYLQFVLSDGPILAGHPGTKAGLDAHLAFLPQDRRIEWGVCLVGGDLLDLADEVIGRGGHVAIGLGDFSYAGRGAPTNADLVAQVAEIGRRHGREPAEPAEIRAMLGMAA
jgi:uncharacterized protein (DUF849 family)